MKFIVKRGYVKHEGVFYEKGSFFDANSNDVQELLANDMISAADPHIQTDNTDPDFVIPDLNEFAGMKADEQKALLKELGISPSSNAEERIRQYTEFYETVDEDADL